MFLNKQLTINNIQINEFPFEKEISMAAFVIENEYILSLGDDFGEVSIIDGEVSLPSKSRIDIIAEYGEGYYAVVELKLKEIDEKAIKQIERYLSEKETLVEYKEQKWIGIVVGETILPAAALDFRKGKYFGEIPIAAITVKRFKSNDGQVYTITDTYFPEKVKGKDYSKYEFNDTVYNKRKLVLAVIRKYLQDNPKTTYVDLRKIFPDDLRESKSWGVFQELEEAKTKQGNYKRYFTNPKDLLVTGDKVTIAITNQWGGKTFDTFFEHVSKRLRYNIKKYQET